MFLLDCWKINRKGQCPFVLLTIRGKVGVICFLSILTIQGAPDRSVWLQQYLRGASLEMYTETLSNYFVHDLKNFSEAAR